jgi:hypothetical protein
MSRWEEGHGREAYDGWVGSSPMQAARASAGSSITYSNRPSSGPLWNATAKKRLQETSARSRNVDSGMMLGGFYYCSY